MSELTYDRFKRVFLMNVERRSRTAKGKDEGSKTSTKKRPLVLQGEALKAKVAENVSRLIDDVWQDAVALRQDPGHVRPSEIRERCQRWYDIACDGLIDEAGYAAVFAEIDTNVSRTLGTEFRMNRRYRTWTPGYLVLQIPPTMIDEKLDQMLYVPLSLRLSLPAFGTAQHAEGLASLSAHADMMMDGEIHPWIDGCSRVSTALVLWLAALGGHGLPLFAPTKDEHYAPLRQGIAAHFRYFYACLSRAQDEVP